MNSIYTMTYFVVNHSYKSIYRLSNWRQTFDEVMDANPTWGMKDDIECYDEDTEAIEELMKLDYITNLNVYELSQYVSDPEFLVWYMGTHEFSVYDITRAINNWEGHSIQFKKAHDALDDFISWKHEQEYMSGEKDEVDMLCEKMHTVM